MSLREEMTRIKEGEETETQGKVRQREGYKNRKRKNREWRIENRGQREGLDSYIILTLNFSPLMLNF